MNINVYEVLDKFESAETKDEKKNVLLSHSNSTFLEVLKNTFHPDVKFVFSKTPKKYIPSSSPPGLSQSSMNQEIKKCYLFMENHPNVSQNLTVEKKEILLIQVLESLEDREADVYMKMLGKNLKTKGLTYKLVKEVFPNLIP